MIDFESIKTIPLKLYFSVIKEEQSRRFERRKNDPLRKRKLSEVDLQAQELAIMQIQRNKYGKFVV